MDEPPKKRPWFQFHLSTAIVAMLVAAGLLWANLCLDPLADVPSADYDAVGAITMEHELMVGELVGTHHSGFGWPWPCVRARMALIWSGPPLTVGPGEPHREILWWPLVGDVAVALAVLCGVGWGTEHFARRRGRKP